jgi:asparagine synthase (glutamine-hydrolysing)
MSLTGGLDTRMIMAWRKAAPGSLPCYTFGSKFRDCRDVAVARRVAQLCQQSYEVIPVADDFLSRFSDYAERSIYLTDGCVDVSRSPDLYVQQRAREIAPVRVAGTYGSEILRPVRPKPHKGQIWAAAFKPCSPMPGLFNPDFSVHIEGARHTYNNLLQGHPVSFAVFRQAPWFHYGVLALEQTQLTVRSPYLDNDFVRTVYKFPQTALSNNAMCLRLIDKNGPRIGWTRWIDLVTHPSLP